MNVLNYFELVERTITINDVGLAVNKEQDGPEESVHSRNIGDHQYIHNTPVDYVINFMEHVNMLEAENHDDFYLLENGNIFVEDSTGVRIIYESALKNFKYVFSFLLTSKTWLL